MLRRIYIGFLIGIMANTAVAQLAEALTGEIRGKTYFAPSGVYSIDVPVLLELGGTVTDRENVVVFQDSYSVHVSIGCFPQDATQRWELSTRGLKEYLGYFFTTFAFPDFLQMFPGSQIERTEFLPQMLDGSLLVYSLLPGGTMFAGRLGNLDPNTPVPVAKRGNLLFVKHGFVYVISIELAERALEGTAYRKTPAEEDAILRQRLEVLTDSMSFRRPPAAAPGR